MLPARHTPFASPYDQVQQRPQQRHQDPRGVQARETAQLKHAASGNLKDVPEQVLEEVQFEEVQLEEDLEDALEEVQYNLRNYLRMNSRK